MIGEQNIESELLEAIIENLEEGVVIMNQHGEFITCNSISESIFDLQDEPVTLGQKSNFYVKNTVHEDGSPMLPKDFPSAITIRTGKACDYIVIGICTKKDNFKWVKVKSRPMVVKGQMFVITTFSDITQLQKTNKKLQEKNLQLQSLIASVSLSEKKFSGVFEYSGIGIALLSIEGQCIDANPALCKMLGYTPVELLFIRFRDITHPDDVVKDLHFTKLMLKKRIDTYEMVKRFYKKDGGILWVSLTVSLVWKDEETADFFICQIVDITETKTLEKQLNEKNKKLEITSGALEKSMKQLRDFNHIVAHNLRGPVLNIELLLKMLAGTKVDEEKAYFLELLGMANKEQNKTLNELVRILQVELYEEVPFEVASFEETIDKVKKDLMGSIIDKKAQIKTTFEVTEILYPKVYLESIMYNLVSNSLKYSQDAEPPVITISSRNKNNKVELQVSDNGLGMDMEKHKNELFKPNKTFHTGYDSKGIGLYMTKKQVEHRGGSICAESKVGEGSTFTICL